MGYYFYIGEAKLDYEPSEHTVQIAVESIVGDADAVSKGIRQANWLNCSATYFTEFAEAVGLGELFYGRGWCNWKQEYEDCTDGFHRQTPLIRHSAPCASPICQEDLDLIRSCLAARRASLPGKPAIWEEDDPDGTGDEYLAALEWLEYWFERTLATCKVPIFHLG